MRKRATFALVATAALAVSGLAMTVPGASAMPSGSLAKGTGSVHACAPRPAPHKMTCLALVRVGPDQEMMKAGKPLAAAFTPDDIQQAYNLKGLKSGGATVAIVDAYGYSGLEADLAKYRDFYGLPPCTTKNGCLTIMNQNGTDNYPPDNSGWDLEQALDVDAVSATCPDCKILVVQANNSSIYSLATAVNRASMQKGVVAISNSYIGNDRKKVVAYNHRGIAITAGTGDSGWQGGAYPADDSHVIAVGGTSVTRDDSSRGYSEAVWSGTGSGCATMIKTPKWQLPLDTGCDFRANSDVAAAADPTLGGLSIVFNGSFSQVGGTSEATPIIASVFALSGNTKGFPGKLLYEDQGKHLYDITDGSNGSCGPPLCDAGKGWDGPTGWGTPNGVDAF